MAVRLHGAQMVLRSETPEPMEQESRGPLMAHFAIRGLMHEVALRADVDPDKLSFMYAVQVVQRRLARYAAIHSPPEESPARGYPRRDSAGASRLRQESGQHPRREAEVERLQPVAPSANMQPRCFQAGRDRDVNSIGG